jgi:hypothetical protein
MEKLTLRRYGLPPHLKVIQKMSSETLQNVSYNPDLALNDFISAPLKESMGVRKFVYDEQSYYKYRHTNMLIPRSVAFLIK